MTATPPLHHPEGDSGVLLELRLDPAGVPRIVIDPGAIDPDHPAGAAVTVDSAGFDLEELAELLELIAQGARDHAADRHTATIEELLS